MAFVTMRRGAKKSFNGLNVNVSKSVYVSNSKIGWLLLWAQLIMLTACSSITYDPYIPTTNNTIPGTDQVKIERSRNLTLPIGSALFLAKPQLPKSMAEAYPEAQDQIGQEMIASFARKFPNLITNNVFFSVDQALRQAQMKHADFLLYPSALGWHQTQLAKKLNCNEEKVEVATPRGVSNVTAINACDWDFSVPFDEVQVTLYVYDVRSQQALDAITINSKSGWVTFVNDEPQKLLRASLNQVVDQLSTFQ